MGQVGSGEGRGGGQEDGQVYRVEHHWGVQGLTAPGGNHPQSNLRRLRAPRPADQARSEDVRIWSPASVHEVAEVARSREVLGHLYIARHPVGPLQVHRGDDRSLSWYMSYVLDLPN